MRSAGRAVTRGATVVVDGAPLELVLGLAEGTGRRWLASGQDLDPDQVARRIADLAWAGLRGIRPI